MDTEPAGARIVHPARMMRRPFLTPIWMSGLGLMLMFGFLSFEAWRWFVADSTTIILVRHAEKEPGGNDPPLTPAGEVRAAALARMFGDAAAPGHIDAIYVTDTTRNRMTAAPLAARLGLAPTVISGTDIGALARRILREHEGGRVLVVGHADTIQALVASFTRTKNVPPIAGDEYGTMYIVTVPRIGRADFLRLNY